MSVLLKWKSFLAWDRGELSLWSQLKVRPLVSYCRSWYAPWFTLGCQTLVAMARYCYHSDADMNVRDLHSKVAHLNGTLLERRECRGNTRIQIGDIDAFYNNIDRDRALNDIRDATEILRSRRRLWA